MRVKKEGLPAVCAKAGASLGFLILSLAAMYRTNEPAYAWFMIIGQIFGLLGDIFLDQRKDPFYMHIGFAAFGIGHLFFSTGLLTTFPFTGPDIAAAALAALVITALVSLAQKAMGLRYGSFTIDAVLYTAVVGFTAALPAMGLLGGRMASPAAAVFLIGMLLFLFSDLVLSQMYFGKGKNNPLYAILNLLLYYAAQYTLSYSIFCLA